MPRTEIIRGLPMTPNEKVLNDALDGVEAYIVTCQYYEDTGDHREDTQVILARSWISALEKALNLCAIFAQEAEYADSWDITSVKKVRSAALWIAQDV